MSGKSSAVLTLTVTDVSLLDATHRSYESLTAMGQFELWDQDEATNVSDGDTTCRGSILVGPGDTVQMNWQDGEMPFVTNCVASITAGTVNIGGVQASGYLA